MSNNIQVLYAPGSYGTYLAWAVYSYSNLNNSGIINLPFGPHGSAHLFRNTPGYDLVHPSPTHNVVPNLDNFIFIVPTKFLEYSNNQYSKQDAYDMLKHISNLVPGLLEKLSNGWNKSAATWEIRELLSFSIDDTFNNTDREFKLKRESLQGWKNVIDVHSDDILFDFSSTLSKIFNHFGLSQTVDSVTIDKNHKSYLLLQSYIGRDFLVSNIVSAVINGADFNIPALTILDEARIQGVLRSKGFDIQCCNLNQFPETTTQLRKLLTQAAN
jgi:hypothetical protein